MKTKILNPIVASLASLAVFTIGTALRADSFAPLNVGDQVLGPTFAGLTGGPFSNLTGGTAVASTSSAITLAGYTGVFGTTVLSGVSQNSFGANRLTFVYEFQTLTAIPAASPNPFGQGISNTIIHGWNNSILANFAMGSSFFFGSSGTPVLPLYAGRFNNGDVHFGFPLDDFGPPIFAGENSYQMILFTNSITYTDSFGLVDVTDYNDSTIQTATGLATFVGVAPPTVVGVPDGSSTAIFFGLGLVLMSVIRRRPSVS